MRIVTASLEPVRKVRLELRGHALIALAHVQRVVPAGCDEDAQVVINSHGILQPGERVRRAAGLRA